MHSSCSLTAFQRSQSPIFKYEQPLENFIQELKTALKPEEKSEILSEKISHSDNSTNFFDDFFSALVCLDNISVWSHNDEPYQWVVGLDQVAHYKINGDDRFNSAKTWWEDTKKPYIFAAFTFSPDSCQKSVIIAPQIIINSQENLLTFQSLEEIDKDSFEEQKNNLIKKIRNTCYTKRTANTGQKDTAHHTFPLSIRDGDISSEKYLNVVSDAKQEINNVFSDLEKVVIARDIIIKTRTQIHISSLVNNLRYQQTSSWTYKVADLIGATPEILIDSFKQKNNSTKTSGNVLSLRVLAGTLPKNKSTNPQELTTSQKQRKEHKIAQQSALKHLQDKGLNPKIVTDTHLLELQDMWHLSSDIEIDPSSLPEKPTALDIIMVLHPTAAVGGTPDKGALGFIKKHEQIDRSFFAGPVGWMNPNGEGQFGIALRGALIKSSEEFHLFAGAGIMPDSEPHDELEETNLKFSPMLEALKKSK